MAITFADLTTAFDPDQRADLLSEWHWLIGEHRLPILFAAIGNAFVQDIQDGSIHLLDAGEGKLVRVADSVDEFRGLIDEEDFVRAFFEVEAIAEMKVAGRTLQPGQVWGFIKPPVLGGTFSTDNYEPTDLAVHFSIQGQIHRQVMDLPDGAPVGSILLK
ncbi:T6SS immunity protein Tdi1 domain-containing protein [Roseateles sp. DXS20W]|uniref:T6SS immunity protein Tdi1 domain-containing protein n=1 Tax=Pelomonas lactea TaxID=3299030 RepID=A0ABW7GN07_9BURK